eukprot:2285564-Rhodomonas_salina.8
MAARDGLLGGRQACWCPAHQSHSGLVHVGLHHAVPASSVGSVGSCTPVVVGRRRPIAGVPPLLHSSAHSAREQ